jgi:hypothetical protein
MHNKDEFSRVGFMFKTPAMLFVVFSHFGQLAIMPYPEFLNRPYIARIKARNFENPPVDVARKSMDFVAHVKAIRDGTAEHEKTGRHADKVAEGFKEAMVRVNLEQVVSLYFHHLGVLRVNPLNRHLSARDYDLEHPHIFHKDYELGRAFIVRSEATKDLKDNMNFK